MKMYVVCTHSNRLVEAILMSTLNIPLLNRRLREMFLFYHENVCCVYSFESPCRGDSNEYTEHTIM